MSAEKSSPWLIAVAWVVVLIPAAWGLTHTVESAMTIFTTGSAPAK
jgi:uncharacterized membrane protein